jgi:hypothetical protein
MRYRPTRVESTCGDKSTKRNAPDLNGVWRVTEAVIQLKAADGKAPPLLPAAQKSYDERNAKCPAGKAKEYDPSLQTCKPPGEPRIAYESKDFPFEIQQSDDRFNVRLHLEPHGALCRYQERFRRIPPVRPILTSIAVWSV